MTFTVLGIPRTKKNSRRVAWHGGKMHLLQSKDACAWEQGAILQLRPRFNSYRRPPWSTPVNLRAIVYRDRNVGDLGNFLSAVCDALERAGVVANDKWILGFDGSRLQVDRARPRVEIELTPLE